jgi:hypothetical protein
MLRLLNTEITLSSPFVVTVNSLVLVNGKQRFLPCYLKLKASNLFNGPRHNSGG